MTGNSGRTALHYAVDQGYTAAVKYLVEHNADVDAHARQPNHLQDPPLIKALQRNDQVVINILIDGKADTECMDLRGWRPLHFAARHGYMELASRLLDRGCERQPQTHLRETPFFLAMKFHQPEIIKLFLDSGMGTSDIETFDGSTYAHVAAYQGRLDVLNELVKMNRSIIFKTTEAGVDALYIAALFGHHSVVEFLILSGLRTSGMGRFIDIPLAAAAGNGCIQTVDTLLRLGARVNETDLWQRTPLSRAADQGYLNIAHHLLKAGANPYILDATGFTAFDYCANNPAMLEILRPWRPAPCIFGIPRSPIERLSPSISCIIRSARAMSQHRRENSSDHSLSNDTIWHLRIICSSLLRLALSEFTSPCLRARKVYTAVPAKRAEILRECRIILADSQDIVYCCSCGQIVLKEFYICSTCRSFVCELCFSRLRLETHPHVRVEVWKELRQLEKDVCPISAVLRGLTYQDSSVVGEVLSQDDIIKHWVLAKRQEYAKWRKRWGLHHYRTVDFHGYSLVHTMARVLSSGQDCHLSDDESVSDSLNIEHCNNAQDMGSVLTERWQNMFFFYLSDDDFDRERCTHSFFLRASKHRQGLREAEVVFDSEGKLTSETFDRLAEKYEDCLASGDLTFEKLQTRRFTDAIIEDSNVGNNRSEQAIGWESRSGVGADSRNETSSLESASDISSDVTDASAVSDIEDEAQPEIDVEEVLERLLMKRGSLIKEKLLTDENDLVLETAWKLVQAIVYHDTPRPSLADIADQGDEWHTAPGTPVAFASGGCSDDSSHYSTAGSI